MVTKGVIINVLGLGSTLLGIQALVRAGGNTSSSRLRHTGLIRVKTPSNIPANPPPPSFRSNPPPSSLSVFLVAFTESTPCPLLTAPGRCSGRQDVVQRLGQSFHRVGRWRVQSRPGSGCVLGPGVWVLLG